MNEQILSVKVVPRAKMAGVAMQKDVFVCRVTAPAEDGRANDAALKLLAKYLHLPSTRLTIVRGQRSRQKLIRVING